MKSISVALCLAASFLGSCASIPGTTREWAPVEVEMNQPPSLSPQVHPEGDSAVAPDDSETRTQVPDYYVGVGARGLKGDALAVVLGAKLKLFDVDGLTLSTRPALLFGGYDDEWSLPFTLEGNVNSYGFAWFGGAGLRHGMDDLGKTDPMVTGGFDVPLGHRLVLNLTINYMWQSAIDDLDGEFLATINYGF
jgi:hypothetical protein